MASGWKPERTSTTGGANPEMEAVGMIHGTKVEGSSSARDPRFLGLVGIVDRHAHGAVFGTHLTGAPIARKDVFVRRGWNENPLIGVPAICRTLVRRRLRCEPRQPIWPIPETIEIQ